MNIALIVCITLIILLVLIAVYSICFTKEDIDKLLFKLENIQNFFPEKTLIKNNLIGIYNGISIDSKNQKICVIKDGEFIIKPYSSIMEYQILINDRKYRYIKDDSLQSNMHEFFVKNYKENEVNSIFMKILFNESSLSFYDFNLVGASPVTGYKEPILKVIKDAREWGNILISILPQSNDK